MMDERERLRAAVKAAETRVEDQELLAVFKAFQEMLDAVVWDAPRAWVPVGREQLEDGSWQYVTSDGVIVWTGQRIPELDALLEQQP